MSRNIVVDIDGVICQFDFPKLIKEHFGVPILEEWLTCYSLSECLGLPQEAVDKMLSKIVNDKPKFVPGAKENISYLLGQEYQVYILSHRLKYMSSDELEDWLYKYGVPYTYLIDCDNLPSYVHAVVDDNPTKLLEIMDRTTVKIPILFEQLWNKRCKDILNKFEFAQDWDEVVSLVTGGPIRKTMKRS